MADLNCCFCGASLKGHIMIGAGDGTGSRFACKPCACENGIQTCGECARHNILPMNRAKWHKAWREPCAECAAKDAEIARLRACIAEVKELTDTLKLPRAKAYGLVRASLVAIIAKHGVENG